MLHCKRNNMMGYRSIVVLFHELNVGTDNETRTPSYIEGMEVSME